MCARVCVQAPKLKKKGEEEIDTEIEREGERQIIRGRERKRGRTRGKEKIDTEIETARERRQREMIGGRDREARDRTDKGG